MKSRLFELASYGPPPAPETPRMARRRRVASGLCLASVLAVVGMGPFVRILPQVAILVAVLLLATIGLNLLYWVDKNRRDAAFAAGDLVEAPQPAPDPQAVEAAGEASEASAVR